jgi:hypothetical protein
MTMLYPRTSDESARDEHDVVILNDDDSRGNL